MPQNQNQEEPRSFKEQRIRKITQLYYSRQEILNAIFSFSNNREVVPRYFEGFGKRPDCLQYKQDIFEMVKNGATSFHCSEEIWKDPLKLSTDMSEKQLNELRSGWDLLIDIDSKYLDYSKIAAQIIIEFLKFHGIKNLGIKFSGSKGFHLLIPWKSFPKQIHETKTSDAFPEYPRAITKYIIEKTKTKLIERISSLEKPSRYIKDFSISEKVMPDLILVSPRHLFRMPYSLHEKTALASVVLTEEQLANFQVKDADPMSISSINDFVPKTEEGGASELLVQALDWFKEQPDEISKSTSNYDVKKEFKPIKLTNLSEKNFPPSIQKILQGVSDGRKRAVFILINFFRSIGMEREELEQRMNEWNEKNEQSLKDGYIKAQLSWSYRNKIIPPPNFDKDYYKGIGVIPTPEELRYKNPVNYTVKKTLSGNPKDKGKKQKPTSTNFKNND